MKLTLSDAGKLTKVHRSTLDRWIKKKYLKRENGLVETDEIYALMEGRKAGKAYKTVEPSAAGEYGITLERALVVIAGVLKAVPESQHPWLKQRIHAIIDNPKLLAVEPEPSKEAVSKTEADQPGTFEDVWGKVFSPSSISANLDTESAEAKGLGDELKLRTIEYERAVVTLPPAGRVSSNAIRRTQADIPPVPEITAGGLEPDRPIYKSAAAL